VSISTLLDGHPEREGRVPATVAADVLCHHARYAGGEWRIEADSAEEAQELLNSGHGERAHLGECIHCEVASVEK
jgi:hypothetical protein